MSDPVRNYTYDVREGKPSASGAKRRHNCMGSWLLEKSVPEEALPEIDPQITEEGTLLHDAWEREDPEGLTDDQRITYWMGLRLKEQFVQTAADEGMAGFYEEYKEKRVWLEFDGERRLSARFDLLLQSEDKSFWAVGDWKGGWLGAGHAEDNEQLLEIAVILVNNFPEIEKIMVALLQPRLEADEAFTYRVFTRQEIQKATFKVIEHLYAIEEPGHPFNPGDWCTYCRAINICPALKKTRDSIVHLHNDEKHLALAPTRDELALCKVVEKYIYQRKKLARRILKEDPDAIPGVTLNKPARMRHIDSEEGVKRLLNANFEGKPIVESKDELFNCLRLTVTDALGLLRKKTELKGKKLEQALEDIMGDALNISWKEPSIKIK